MVCLKFKNVKCEILTLHIRQLSTQVVICICQELFGFRSNFFQVPVAAVMHVDCIDATDLPLTRHSMTFSQGYVLFVELVLDFYHASLIGSFRRRCSRQQIDGILEFALDELVFAHLFVTILSLDDDWVFTAKVSLKSLYDPQFLLVAATTHLGRLGFHSESKFNCDLWVAK